MTKKSSRADRDLLRKSRLSKKSSAGSTKEKPVNALVVMKGFRLSVADAATWDDKVAASGLPASEFIRSAIIQNKTSITGIKHIYKESPITLETVRLLGKMSNNLNQLARALNSARLAGEITAEECLSATKELQEISRQSKSLIEGN